MIVIDGSAGEGGGQILRTSVALGALTSKPVTVRNIRAGRNPPGLKPQHVAAIEAVAQVCGAEVKGNYPGYGEIVFEPGPVNAGVFSFDVGTAGSATLVIQSLLPVLAGAGGDFCFTVQGGTDVSWSPQADYLKNVTLPLVERFGPRIRMKIARRGYYPKGGGLVEVRVSGSELKPVSLLEPGGVLAVKGVSHAHISLKERQVCERQANSARKNMVYYDKVGITCDYADTLSVGSGITLWAECKNTILGADFLGARDLRAEEVGRKAALGLLGELQSGACLDKHMADQIVPYLAIAGGKATVSEATEHCKTNIWVCNQFGFDVRLEGKTIIAGGDS